MFTSAKPLHHESKTPLAPFRHKSNVYSWGKYSMTVPQYVTTTGRQEEGRVLPHLQNNKLPQEEGRMLPHLRNNTLP